MWMSTRAMPLVSTLPGVVINVCHSHRPGTGKQTYLTSCVCTSVQVHRPLPTITGLICIQSAALYHLPHSCHKWVVLALCQVKERPHWHLYVQNEQQGCPLRLASIAHCFSAPAGKYKLSKQQVEFSKYMVEEGYHIIKISAKHQLVSLCLQRCCIHLGTAWQLGTLLKPTSGELTCMHACCA